MAHRNGRLRLTGNGVVPQTAERAWCDLSAQLLAYEREGDA